VKPIGFIIITYNRCADALELLQNIAQLQDADSLLQEVIVVNNASTDDYTPVKNYIRKQEAAWPFQYYDAPGNLGVAKGRNYALERSTAPYLIMIDDDAVLQNRDCLVNLLREFDTNNTERPKAIVSFKVLYYDTLQMQQNALPHKQYDKHKDLSFFETYYYAGGAHAIRREVFDRVGKYPEDFFYGMEEYDLAFRILDAGYSIVYSDKIVMLHKESPLGRKPKEEKLRMMWVNKCKVAWKYLPKKYFYSTAFMWGLFYLKNTGFLVKGFVKGYREIWQVKKTVPKGSVKQGTLQYLGQTKARLWY
jgi:GT2 family glycosyltransferase